MQHIALALLLFISTSSAFYHYSSPIITDIQLTWSCAAFYSYKFDIIWVGSNSTVTSYASDGSPRNNFTINTPNILCLTMNEYVEQLIISNDQNSVEFYTFNGSLVQTLYSDPNNQCAFALVNQETGNFYLVENIPMGNSRLGGKVSYYTATYDELCEIALTDLDQGLSTYLTILNNYSGELVSADLSGGNVINIISTQCQNITFGTVEKYLTSAIVSINGSYIGINQNSYLYLYDKQKQLRQTIDYGGYMWNLAAYPSENLIYYFDIYASARINITVANLSGDIVLTLPINSNDANIQNLVLAINPHNGIIVAIINSQLCIWHPVQ